MILSKEFYARCCKSYQEAVDELEKEIADIRGDDINANDDGETKAEQIRSKVLNFSKKYLTPKHYWDFCMQNVNEHVHHLETWKKICREIAMRGYRQYYYNKEWNSLLFPGNGAADNDGEAFLFAYGGQLLKLLDFQFEHFFEWGLTAKEYHTYGVTEFDLDYPHKCLRECFRAYERNSSRIPSKELIEKYEVMKALYSRIKAAENNSEAWFKLILEADEIMNDIIFVKFNVEARIGQNLLDAKLWKLYMAYMKQQGQYKYLLDLYSNYCRFFLDDREMLEEYKEAMIKYGPVVLPWVDLFDFEGQYVKVEEGCDNKENIDDKENPDGKETSDCEESSDDEEGGVEDKKLEGTAEDDDNSSCSEAEEEDTPFDKSLCTAFFDTYKRQDFSLTGPLIAYILDNAGHRTLRKLFSSCKFFYVKKSTPICHRLLVGSKEGYKNESLSIQHSSKQELFFKKTFITGTINIGESDNPDKAFISNLIPRLYACEAKYIHLIDQDLSSNELIFLIQHGGVVHLDICQCPVKDGENDYMILEDIMKYLSNIELLCLPNIKTTANTGHALAQQKFYGKLYEFNIDSIFGEAFDANEFLKFCIANRDDKRFLLHFDFDQGFSVDCVEELDKIMDDYSVSCGNAFIRVHFK